MTEKISIKDMKKVYFVGIGGVSMSSLAIILKNNGIAVTGYDMKHSENTDMLEKMGIKIDYEHNTSSLCDVDTVVYTAAVTIETAPELSYAIDNGIVLLTRAELLGLITEAYKYSVGVSGTHGKSSTTGMLSSIYLSHDSESSVISGCVIPQIGASYKIGNSDRVVFEACEYKDSFLSMRPSVKVILNCKLDHVDYFKDIESIKSSFRKYAETDCKNTQSKNIVIANADCENTVDALKASDVTIYFYSTEKESDFCAKNIEIINGCGVFDLYHDGECIIEKLSLKVPGNHNISNAVAAAAAAFVTDVPVSSIQKGLESFTGVARRFERKGVFCGAAIVDDYAHHPDEITVTLNTAKTLNKKRVICVFQPHTYSRTKALLYDFAKALSIADKVFLAPIFPAREENIYNIFSEDLAKLIHGCECLDSFEKLACAVKNFAKPDDLIITMGAGEAYKVADILLNV